MLLVESKKQNKNNKIINKIATMKFPYECELFNLFFDWNIKKKQQRRQQQQQQR